MIVSQPVQLESWKKRWICGFSPRLRQNIKNSRKSLQKKKKIWKNFDKSFFWHFSVEFFFFFYICTLEELLNASGLRKYQKNDIFFENLVFSGAFFGPKGAFSHRIPKKHANFIIQSCSQHISLHFLFLHMLCKKNCPAANSCFCNFFSNIFFLGSLKNSYWFIYEII